MVTNPVTQGLINSQPIRFAGNVLSKAFSLPATLVFNELFESNPWGDKNSPMYGKGPGSLEYQKILERANANNRTQPIEEDYISVPQFGSINTIDLGKDSQANDVANALEKYGFNENFALEPSAGDNYSVVRSDKGQTLDARDQWLADTANSPAAQSGAFADEQRWQQHLENQKWRKEQGRDYSHGMFL